MAILGQLEVQVGADMSGFERGMMSASDRLHSFGSSLTSMGRSLMASVTLPLAAAGAAAIMMASDAAESASKFETVFGDTADEMDAWISGLQATVPATTKELRDMTAGLHDLLVPMGILPADAAKMDQEFVALAADLASFNNIPIEQALADLRSGIVGQSEPLLKYGVDTRAAVVETKALELGLIAAGGEMTNSARAQAVLAIATEQSTFAIGDAARTADSTANSMRFFWRDVKELATAFGEILLPAITPIIQKAGELIGWLREMDSSTQKVIVVIAAFAAAIGPLLLVGGTLITVLGTIVGAVGAIGAPVLAVGAAIAVLVAAFAAVVGALVLFVARNEETRAAVMGAWSQIQEAAMELWTELQPIIEDLQKLWAEYGDEFKAVVETVLVQAIAVITGAIKGLAETVAFVVNVIQGDWRGAWNNVRDIAQIAKDTVSRIVGSMFDLVRQRFDLAIREMRDRAERVKEAVVGPFERMREILVGGSIVPEMWEEIVRVTYEGGMRMVAASQLSTSALVAQARETKELILEAHRILYADIQTVTETGFDALVAKVQEEGQAIVAAHERMAGNLLSIADQMTGGSGFFGRMRQSWGDLTTAVTEIFGAESGAGKLMESIGGWAAQLAAWAGPAGMIFSAVMSIGDLFGIDLMAAIKTALSALTSVIGDFFSWVWDGVKGLAEDIWGFFGDVFGGIGDFFGDVFGGIGDFFDGLFSSAPEFTVQHAMPTFGLPEFALPSVPGGFEMPEFAPPAPAEPIHLHVTVLSELDGRQIAQGSSEYLIEDWRREAGLTI